MTDWITEPGLAALFASAFLSATLLPGSSEVVLVKVLLDHPSQVVAALVVATLGNTLGAMTTYFVGKLVPAEAGSPRAARANAWLRRHGAPALLLSWLPIIGDALCAAAGWLRIHWAVALAFIAAGKLARYAAIAAGLQFI